MGCSSPGLMQFDASVSGQAVAVRGRRSLFKERHRRDEAAALGLWNETGVKLCWLGGKKSTELGRKLECPSALPLRLCRRLRAWDHEV
jgi:hypothetical protein